METQLNTVHHSHLVIFAFIKGEPTTLRKERLAMRHNQ